MIPFTGRICLCRSTSLLHKLTLSTERTIASKYKSLLNSWGNRYTRYGMSIKKLQNGSVYGASYWNSNGVFNVKPVRLYSSIEQPGHASGLPNLDKEQYVQTGRKIGVTKEEQQALLKKRPKKIANQRILKVAIIGAPNAGKSTLANQLIGWKYSAVSCKVHTTRYKSLGVLTEGHAQIIFLDTPGIITPMQRKKYDMEVNLLRDPHSSLFDADLIIAMVDASQIWNRNHLDIELQKALHLHRSKKSVLVLNKVDIFKKEKDLLHSARLLSEGQFGGNKNWHRPVKRDTHKKKKSLDELFEKADSKNTTISPLSGDTDYGTNITSSELSGDEVNTDRKSEFTKDEGEPMRLSVTDHHTDQPVMSGVTNSKEEEGEIEKDSLKNSKKVSRFENPDEWHTYYSQEVSRVGEEVENKVGYDGFDSVFYTSALDGTEVDTLRNYLLHSATRGDWLYDEDVVTDQDPARLAKMAVWERILEHMPREIPYTVDLKQSLWVVDSDGLLHVEFELFVKKRYMHSFLSENGRMMQMIAAEAKQELMNTFRQEMTLRLIVKPQITKAKKQQEKEL